jgi:hypothetical protein
VTRVDQALLDSAEIVTVISLDADVLDVAMR